MKLKYIVFVTVVAGVFTACTNEELVPDVDVSDQVVESKIVCQILGSADSETRTMVDNTNQNGDVHTLWILNDEIGLISYSGKRQGLTDLNRNYKIYANTIRLKNKNTSLFGKASKAEFTPVNYSSAWGNGTDIMKPLYAFYPWTESSSEFSEYYSDYTRPSLGFANIDDATPPNNTQLPKTVTWTLPNEQEWHTYESIRDRDWMVSRAYITGTNVTGIIFRPLTSLLRFNIDIDWTAHEDLFQYGDVETVKIEKATDCSDFPYLVGKYEFNLKELDNFDEAIWTQEYVNNNNNPWVDITSIWHENKDPKESDKELTVVFNNVSSVDTPTRGYANVAPTLKAWNEATRTGHKVKVTVTTTNTIMVADNLPVLDDFKAGMVYNITLTYNANTEGQWTVTPKSTPEPELSPNEVPVTLDTDTTADSF